ncbi:Benzoyl-CoA reductase/2-hydroxyglutaryl-CoA dehydratase subunit, BcrC/BadD/HgdB [Lachnospiraceae bacterium JC7]|nr:Benzoyl-CoA reductase/2-hydroxyglutaryl-CoA dehydratase subunit, BcrC/BadD/HgdB [Lachnospiraceae bacterium JC7]
MRLIDELPEVFESFAEQRKKSFIKVKELKEQGIPIVGSYCTYFPKELAMAAGAAPVSLCSTSDETIVDAEKDLPKNLCPLIKSSYGFAKTDKCPFFYFSDVIVGETTCDGKKKMYEIMNELKEVFLLRLPHKQDEAAVREYRNEMVRFKEYLENKFERTISEDDIRAAVHLNNRTNRAMKDLYGVMRHDPCPITGYELFKVLYGSTFRFDRLELTEEIEEMTARIEKEYEEGKNIGKRPRIIITGCPIGGATEKVIRAVEENGGVIVGYENCNGEKAVGLEVSEDTDDIYEAVARRYLNIGCSVMSPNPNRFKVLGEMIDEFHADGVLEMDLQACLTYDVESRNIRKFVTEEKNIPYLKVETDYSQSDVGQLNTRIAAFIEMM